MPLARLLLASLVTALALPSAALAGAVTRDGDTLTYASNPNAAAGDTVVLFVENSNFVFDVDQGVTSTDCDVQSEDAVSCASAAAILLNLTSHQDTLSISGLPASTTIEAHGGAGGDSLDGSGGNDKLYGDGDGDTIDAKGGDDRIEGGLGGDYLTGGPGVDTIFGQEDDDNLYGHDGNDILDGGAGSDHIEDDAGNDTITGGGGNDTSKNGTGADTYSGGDGSDRVSYENRTAPVFVTLDGVADDGEQGEGDNSSADVEEAFGGSGNDRLTGNPSANVLIGGAGNDTLVGGAGDDRIEGGDGDDTIDTRDGGYDSIDCGNGNDTVLADPGDGTTACEIAPDADGDGYLVDTDCAPNDPNINPGKGEVFGNAVDEDCSGSPNYLRVINPIQYKLVPRSGRKQVRFTKLLIREIRAGDVIEVRCSNKRRGCPFTRKRVTGTAGKTTLNVATLLKKRWLKPGATIEIRITRANEIGKLQRYKISRKLNVTATTLCIPPGTTAPVACV